MISPAIDQARTIDQVVEIVNAANQGEAIQYFGGSDSHTGDELAGQYAFSCAEDAGYGMDEGDFEAHLECLQEAGAKFDWTKALAEAVRIKKL